MPVKRDIANVDASEPVAKKQLERRYADRLVTVIVNADDLGYSHEVNDAVFSLMADGHIRSATILANAPAVQDAISKLRCFPDCSFGAHLNLSEFIPLLGHATHESLISPNGSFHGGLRPTSVLHPRTIQSIGREWEAQIQKLLSAGVRITHIDSHHHIHTNPFLLRSLHGLRMKYGIQKVRISRNLFSRNPATSMRIGKSVYNKALKTIAGFRITDGFTDLRTFVDLPPEAILLCKTVEIETHPGNRGFHAETRLCASDWRKTMPFKIKCGNYSDLV